jgi:hypothetical protein
MEQLRNGQIRLANFARRGQRPVGHPARSYVESDAALPFQAPPTLFNVEISGSRRFASQSYSLARLKHIGEAAGATVNDVTLAICAGALREYLQAQGQLPKKPLIAMVPVSLHGETTAGGNQVSLLLANLATHIADPLKRLQAHRDLHLGSQKQTDQNAPPAKNGARHLVHLATGCGHGDRQRGQAPHVQPGHL